MFTIKLYGQNNYRQRILEAESFTILRSDDGGAEITLHQKNSSDDSRVDISFSGSACIASDVPSFEKAIIENSVGKTTEIVAPSLRTGMLGGAVNEAGRMAGAKAA